MRKISKAVAGVSTFLTAALISVGNALASTVPQSGMYLGAQAGSTGVENLVIDILKYVLGIAGLIAVVFLVIGGISYITAGGNEETTKKATRTLLNAVIGMVIIFASYAIVITIQKNVLGITSGTFIN